MNENQVEPKNGFSRIEKLLMHGDLAAAGLHFRQRCRPGRHSMNPVSLQAGGRP